MCAKSDASFLEWSKGTLTKVVMSSEKETDKKKIVVKGIRDISPKKRVDQILLNLDGTKRYEIIGKNKSDVLNKLTDGLPLKRETRSNWPGY